MKICLLLTALFLLAIHTVNAQSDTTVTSDEPTFFDRPDKEPIYPGGMAALAHDVRANLKYPASARKAKLGKVFVQFVVDETGQVRDITIIKGVSEDCDRAAINAVSKLNRWIPGLKNDKPVKTRFVLPINF